MKRSKFSDSQILHAVKRVETGIGVPDICPELGISTATFYKWRTKYGGMDVSMMSRMKELEEENRRLKKMYLEEKLKAEIVAEALEKKWSGHLAEGRWPRRRSQSEVRAFGLPVRRFASANPATATSVSLMLKTTKWPIG
jgi:putative transposase